jgi:hypothetical protein
MNKEGGEKIMRIRFMLVLVSLSLAAATILPKATEAQEAEKQEHAPQPAAQTKPENIYRVDYTLHELENGKRTNTRNYTLMVSAQPIVYPGAGIRVGDWTGFRVGSRIPVAMGKESFQYFDLGVKINCRLKQGEDYLLIETTLEINSIAASEPRPASAGLQSYSNPQTPVIRSLNLSSITQAIRGKSALVGSIDDVTANRRYEIEVTATKVK